MHNYAKVYCRRKLLFLKYIHIDGMFMTCIFNHVQFQLEKINLPLHTYVQTIPR